MWRNRWPPTALKKFKPENVWNSGFQTSDIRRDRAAPERGDRLNRLEPGEDFQVGIESGKVTILLFTSCPQFPGRWRSRKTGPRAGGSALGVAAAVSVWPGRAAPGFTGPCFGCFHWLPLIVSSLFLSLWVELLSYVWFLKVKYKLGQFRKCGMGMITKDPAALKR